MTDSASAAGRLVLVTGLSGSGKSTAAKCFEDLGYYLVDNLPLSLLEPFLQNPSSHASGRTHIAVVTDVRAPGFAEELPRILEDLDASVERVLVFLEASDDVLVRRFSETRRPHPLSKAGPLLDGIRNERKLLAELRARADFVIDTSECSVHDLKQQIFHEFSEGLDRPEPIVSLVSFGFKHGIPKATDLLFDVRFLPNPFFIPELKEHTGLDASVRTFLEEHEEFHQLADRLEDLLLFVLPKYKRENRSYLSVAIGCTGGHHRSVAMAERLRDRLVEKGWPVQLTHRDLSRE